MTKEENIVRALFSSDRLRDIGSDYGVDFAMGDPEEFALDVAAKAYWEAKQEFIAMLEARMKRMLDVAGEELTLAESHCFHLMEICRGLEGKPTCGLYDDNGPAKV